MVRKTGGLIADLIENVTEVHFRLGRWTSVLRAGVILESTKMQGEGTASTATQTWIFTARGLFVLHRDTWWAIGRRRTGWPPHSRSEGGRAAAGGVGQRPGAGRLGHTAEGFVVDDQESWGNNICMI